MLKVPQNQQLKSIHIHLAWLHQHFRISRNNMPSHLFPSISHLFTSTKKAAFSRSPAPPTAPAAPSQRPGAFRRRGCSKSPRPGGTCYWRRWRRCCCWRCRAASCDVSRGALDALAMGKMEKMEGNIWILRRQNMVISDLNNTHRGI